ncbi:hypothetical protein AAZV13_18G112200 [Glycine max]
MGFNGVDVVEAQKRYLGVISVIQRWLWMNSNIELVLVYCKCKGFDFSLYVWRLDPLNCLQQLSQSTCHWMIMLEVGRMKVFCLCVTLVRFTRACVLFCFCICMTRS